MARPASKGRKTKYALPALTATLIASLLDSGVVDGQGTTLWNPVKTTCNLRYGRGTLVGDKMFVDGGEQIDQFYYGGIDIPLSMRKLATWQNKHLWELDLSAKFNTSKPPWTAHAKPDDWNSHYNGAAGTLWNLGDDTFYTLGGWMSPGYEGPAPGSRIGAPYYTSVKAADGSTIYRYQLPPAAIHAYNTTTANWTSISLPSDIHRLTEIGYTQSKRNKVGYTLGGFSVVEQQAEPTNKDFIARTANGGGPWQTTLSAYDFRKNTFNTSELPDDIGPTAYLILHSLDRVGEEGVLISLAGKSKKGNRDDYRPMNEIWVYDVASSYWMKQAATGDIPPVRVSPCSVLVPAPDFSSYQLYVFSGVTESGVLILDMYVLSIAAFIWKKIDLVNYPNELGMARMACGLYEDRQFIIVPGDVNVSTSAVVNNTFFLKCNMNTAVHIFDTYDWIFKAEFDPDNKGPKVPPAIVNLIGGDEKGSATLRQPKAGWDTKELGQVFQIRNQLPATVDGVTNSTNKTTTGYGDQENTNGGDINESAIAGGIVGGSVCLGLLGLLFWWRRRQDTEQTALPELGPNGYNEASQELQAYRPPQELQVYRPPRELQAYEPPEMGGIRYYSPSNLAQEQEHPEGVGMNDNPPPASVYPITAELQQQQLQPLEVDGH